MTESARKSDLVDLEMVRHHVTERAVLVSLDGDKRKAVWLPIAHVEVVCKNASRAIVEVTMPEWLAVERGLV
jgi:hypothetical protein